MFAENTGLRLYENLAVSPLGLTDNEKTDYLANLWLLARADKSLSDEEKNFIDQIQKRLQAKRSHNTSAQKAVENGGYSLRKVGSFADQVQNLEDMIAVAISDSDLAQAETALIASFCGLIGIQQEQLDLITSDASKRVKTQAAKISCAKCGAQIQSDARFCPACGAAVETVQQANTALEFDIPKTGYAITFSESTAPGFTTAVELAKQIGQVQTVLKNKRTWYLVSIPTERFLDVMRIARALSGMRNRGIYNDGQQLNWDEVFGFIWCAAQRDQAYKPVEYCFGKDENRINPWGCKQARLDWNEWSNWFSYGRWEQTGIISKRNVWVFDKERIRHDLATNLHRFRFCPYLNQSFVDAVLSAFPDRIDVTDTGPWKYNFTYDETPGSIKATIHEGEGDFSYTREGYVDGVRPRGLLPLKEIITKAFSTSQVKPEISAEALLTK
jgi:uncharacterized tellurite resistance protein B-like protein